MQQKNSSEPWFHPVWNDDTVCHAGPHCRAPVAFRGGAAVPEALLSRKLLSLLLRTACTKGYQWKPSLPNLPLAAPAVVHGFRYKHLPRSGCMTRALLADNVRISKMHACTWQLLGTQPSPLYVAGVSSPRC
jgi:hypothetical protein